MKTLNEIIEIVEKEHKENPHRVEHWKEKKQPINMLGVLTVEGIHKQVENAPEDKEFSVYWVETVPPVDDALMGGMTVSKQKFNNKKEMIPVE